MRRVLALFVVLLLATLGAGLGAPPKSSGLPKLGIVSAIGDKFYLRKVGFTVFGNESEEIAVDSWGIDDVMTAKIRTALAPRFDVRPVKYRRSAFVNVENRISLGTEPLRAETVRAEVPPQGLDHYLIVTKMSAPYGQTNQSLAGLGIIEGNDGLVFVCAFHSISLVDGRDWTLGRATYATLPAEPNFLGMPRSKGVSRKVDKSWWPTSRDAASNQRLKRVIVELIDESLPGTLRKMQLLQ
jgi:hypothetical protein